MDMTHTPGSHLRNTLRSVGISTNTFVENPVYINTQMLPSPHSPKDQLMQPEISGYNTIHEKKEANGLC